MDYYGDKISPNMVITPEGYLICKNVPIGRTGWMNYYGQELPAIFNEPTGQPCKVYRSPEELFSPATIASFEGKPVTNTHPPVNLDINTVPMTERGHAQNVRRDGEFLVADLYVNDAGLISEVQNDIKREVSSGYDCSWHKIGEGQYEQRDIVGNHVAVVPNGRAGPKVAIQDSKPEEEKKKMEVKKNMKISKQILAAIGFKQFVQDAEPEDIAKAMEAMKEEDGANKEEPVAPAKEADPEPGASAGDEKIIALEAKVDKLIDIVGQLVQSDKEVHKEIGAEDIMDAIEKDLDKDPEPDPEEKKDEAKDVDPTPEVPEISGVADAALKKFVQDMKPVIMAIPDEKARIEAAKKFASSVHDARSHGANGYVDILGVVAANKKAAMDKISSERQSLPEAAETAAKNWKDAGEKMKGGGK